MKIIWISFLSLVGCATQSPTTSPSEPLSWLTGCWQSQAGDFVEHWRAEGGYLFGHAVTYSQGQAVFFEQMRIDPATPPIFNAYPRGTGPSAFPATAQALDRIVFANAAHDFPQKITYQRSGDTLSATISLIDDSQATDFTFAPCPKG